MSPIQIEAPVSALKDLIRYVRSYGDMEQAEHGPWVRYEDVQRLLTPPVPQASKKRVSPALVMRIRRYLPYLGLYTSDIRALLDQVESIEAERPAPETTPPLSWVERNRLRTLIDNVWNEATESPEVPDTRWADRIIDKWLADQSPPKTSAPICPTCKTELAFVGDICWHCHPEART